MSAITRWIELRPKERVLIGTGRDGGSVRTTLPYIPGRALRGAWAERLLGQGSARIVETVREVTIGNLFPVAAGRRIAYASPMLLSMLTCKQAPGFRGDPEPRRGHGVVDMLLPLLAYRLLEEAGARFAVPFAVTCPECTAAAGQGSPASSGRMEPREGFFAAYSPRPNARAYTRVEVEYETHTRVALSPLRRTAVEGLLYTTTAISPTRRATGSDSGPLVFIGRVSGPEDRVDELLDAVRETAIGGMRTRGYGAVEVRETDVALPPLAERLRAFNERLFALWADLRRLAANAPELPEHPGGRYFSVDLLAPGIFRDRGLPVLAPALTGPGGAPLRPVLWLTRRDVAAGWSEAWGLPKPTALAARMGSSYVFRCPEPTAESELLGFLEELETHGVGERRDEGFGECLVCHPFHLEVEER